MVRGMSQAHDSLGNGRMEALERRIHRLENAVAAFQDTRQARRTPDRTHSRAGTRLFAYSCRQCRQHDRRRTRPLASRDTIGGQAARFGIRCRAALVVGRYYQDRACNSGMFFDYRYRTSPWVGLITVTILAAIVFSWFFQLPIPLLGSLLALVFQVALLFVLFKV